jgi:hypothetical protein
MFVNKRQIERDIEKFDFSTIQSNKLQKTSIDDTIDTLEEAKQVLSGILVRFVIEMVIMILKKMGEKIKDKIEDIKLKKKRNANTNTSESDKLDFAD